MICYGTANNTYQNINSTISLLAGSAYATTASPDSWATIILVGVPDIGCLQPVLYDKPKIEDILVRAEEVNINISEKAFEYFVRVLNDPPAPNSNLSRLLLNDHK